MTHWKLTLAYDGTPFRGWQIQPDLPTVQGLLADAIHRTVGERVLPQGSGRTDAGVHALGQVASFALAAPIPAANLHNALNRCLPPSIRVVEAQIVSSDFHARHSALRKTYEYRIFSLKPALYPRSDTDDKARVPHPSQSHRDGWDAESSLALAIGPEGGWTSEEMSLFTQRQWTHATLGPRILRAETAAIAAIAIVATMF